MLIGDIIVGVRAILTDMPQVLPPPHLILLQPTSEPGNGSVGVGPYSVVATFTTPWGETAASNELIGTLVSPNNTLILQVNDSNDYEGDFPIVTGINIYVGKAAGGETIKFTYTGGYPGEIITISVATGNPTYQAPPNKSSAYLPDTNGRFCDAYAMYRTLNEALTICSVVAGGIPDVSGIQMFEGQGFYTMPGIWDRLENSWFDGYPVGFDSRSGAFYRNVLSGITFIGILQQSGLVQQLELQPQPNRTGGNTITTAVTGIGDTAVSINDTSQFGLSLGMFQMGTEICSYGSISGGQLIGVARGLGGTSQQNWPVNTPIIELNFRFGGLRLIDYQSTSQYQVGQALSTLNVPPIWIRPIQDYMVSRQNESRANPQEAARKLKDMVSFIKDYAGGRKVVAGPRQVGGMTPAGDGYPSASSGGRIIVP